MTCIPPVFTYTFRQWLTRHKIKSIFYDGGHRLDEPEEKKKTVYGRSADCPLSRDPGATFVTLQKVIFSR